MEAPRRLRGLLTIVLWCTAPAAVTATEYVHMSRPVPTAVDEKIGPIEVAYPERETGDARPSGFFAGAELELRPRAYFLRRDRPQDDLSEALAAGGSATLRSGWWHGLFSLGGALYTSQPVAAGAGSDATALLAPGQDGITVVGEAYSKLRLGPVEITSYRQRYDLPFLNSQDGRMIPNTFEGYSLEAETFFGRVDFGYVRKVKLRNRERFVDISTALGVERERGLWMGGVFVDALPGVELGLTAAIVPDVLSSSYGEIVARHTTRGGLQLRAGFQLLDQRSIGQHLLFERAEDVQMGGLELGFGAEHWSLVAGVSKTGSGRVLNPFGGNPSYLSLIDRNFTDADELAWKVGSSVGFDPIGLAGLSLYLSYARGHGARDATSEREIPDRDELDVTLDYTVPSGRLAGAWLRVRGAFGNVASSAPSTLQVRVTFNWALELL